MIQTGPIFQASHAGLQRQTLCFLEIDEVEMAWGSYVKAALNPLGAGYGVQSYGVVGYGF
jgi:hypothetical protein